ncbi:MAG TPA: hypothetical protein VK922_10850 [Gemmatimonadaceae bacterium]|nr:hypothetical protein [Gemmatimonadaceae bacterium]
MRTDGEFTNTAADGSTIIGTYDGYLVPTSHPTQFTIQGTFVITGGTGRFEGASGSGLATGTFDTATGAASLELTGHVSSVGSLRRP